jgi:dihydrofolate reductase/thymidylate synthase
MKNRFFDIIVATSKLSKYGIGKNNTLPWNSKKEMNLFRELSINSFFKKISVNNNIVIMGRNTFESIPEKFRPLKSRVNMIISNSYFSDKYYNHNCVWINRNCAYFKSIDDCFKYINDYGEEENLKGDIFVIGGSKIYNQLFDHENLRYVFMSDLKNKKTEDNKFDVDTYLDFNENNFTKKYESSFEDDNDVSFNFNIYQKNGLENQNNNGINPNIINMFQNIKSLESYTNTNTNCCNNGCITNIKTHYENEYLNLLKDILKNGITKEDRTGTGIISVFGRQLRFNDVDKYFPLLTTKRVFWKGVSIELLWFLSGNTNANKLKEQGVHIWDGNTSREFLDNYGLNNYEEGDCGPFYGFQWRHFGAKYENMHTDYTNQGYDQVKWCINEIKNNPTSRRLIVSAWNAGVLKEMCLNPCHVMYQFYCDPEKKQMSVHMYQRSADVFLGLPFNIASTATFLHLMCYMTGYKPKDVIVSLGDAHIYSNHVEQCHTQLERTPFDWCQLSIEPENDRVIENIEDFKYSELKLINYKSHKTIKAEMAV